MGQPDAAGGLQITADDMWPIAAYSGLADPSTSATNRDKIAGAFHE